MLGKEHPDTLMSMTKLAVVLRDQGKYEQAEEMYREVRRLRETVLGKEHPDTLMSMISLAAVLRDQGKYEQAEEMYREADSGGQRASFHTDQGKSKESPQDVEKNQDQSKGTIQLSMAPKSGHYESSRSSGQEERVYYDPRKERRSASKSTTTKIPVEVHRHRPSGDPKRPSSIDSKQWK